MPNLPACRSTNAALSGSNEQHARRTVSKVVGPVGHRTERMTIVQLRRSLPEASACPVFVSSGTSLGKERMSWYLVPSTIQVSARLPLQLQVSSSLSCRYWVTWAGLTGDQRGGAEGLGSFPHNVVLECNIGPHPFETLGVVLSSCVSVQPVQEDEDEQNDSATMHRQEPSAFLLPSSQRGPMLSAMPLMFIYFSYLPAVAPLCHPASCFQCPPAHFSFPSSPSPRPR
eukprot:764457-Hanusia_phi.AAC.1